MSTKVQSTKSSRNSGKPIVKRCLRLQAGSSFDRKPNQPIIHINGNGKMCYLWIGNDAPNDGFCYGTLSGQKTLRKLAESILAASR